MAYIVSGIQQVGIGVENAEEAWRWYRQHFGMDVPIFKDAATASLMTRYTAGVAEERYAILAMNMQGGGGFEIWQYTSRKPQPSEFQPRMGDTGIFAVKIKSHHIEEAYAKLVAKKAELLSPLSKSPDGRLHFYVKDPFGNTFEVIQSKSWFKKGTAAMGGVSGCVIGVTDIEKALPLYRDVLGYNQVINDSSGKFADFNNIPGGGDSFRRVLLTTASPCRGAFSRLLGSIEIELVEVKERKPRKIYANRNWGDLGFIHVCFDIRGMKSLGERCREKKFPFTVDSSNSFDMGKAAGHFSYCEDPDGTLIEFVETHKIPIIEKLGWYLNLKNRNPEKPLPDWMLGMLSLNRVRD
jgi:catechol 2,3-dioxygenase-like lactoylglutathione lyase family enzyme